MEYIWITVFVSIHIWALLKYESDEKIDQMWQDNF